MELDFVALNRALLTRVLCVEVERYRLNFYKEIKRRNLEETQAQKEETQKTKPNEEEKKPD